VTDARTALADARIREFIESARVSRLATADTSAHPHCVPLCFALADTAIYFVIDEKPKAATGARIKRMRNIAQNPNVAVVIDHYSEDWSKLAYAMIRGRAHTVADAGEYDRAIAALRAKYLQYRAMDLRRDRNPVVRIEIETIHAWGARFK
jgi:PPOX class probable F420-dependent enzyme